MVKSSKKQKSGHEGQVKAKKGLKVDKVACKKKGAANRVHASWKAAAADALLAELVHKAGADDKLVKLQRMLGYTFSNTQLLEQALTLASARSGPHNARLAWLGDSVLQLIITEMLFEARPQSTAGELTQARQLLEERHMCSLLGARLGIGKMLTRGRDHGLTPAMEAEAVEALLGAVYLDSGLSHHTVKQVYLAIGQAMKSAEQVVQHGGLWEAGQLGNSAAAAAPPPGSNVLQVQVQQQQQQPSPQQQPPPPPQQQPPQKQQKQHGQKQRATPLADIEKALKKNMYLPGWLKRHWKRKLVKAAAQQEQQQQEQQQQQPRKQAGSAAKGEKKRKGTHVRFE